MAVIKDQVVKQFLNKGKLLTPQALDMLLKGESLDSGAGLVITENNVKKKQTYKIIKNITSKKTEATAEDFLRFYKSKYEKIRDIFLAKSPKNYVSINKIDDYRTEIHVIGIVRDIKDAEGKKIVELEDLTGSIPAIFEKDLISDLEPDDVVAVRAVSSKNVLFGKQIIFPDVPLRQPQTAPVKACFLANLNIDEAPKQDIEKLFSWLADQDLHYVFVAGNIGDKAAFQTYAAKCTGKTFFVAPGEKDTDDGYPQLPISIENENIIALSNPAIIDIGAKVLLTHNFSVSMLKKRHLGKPKTILDEDRLVLEDVPDAVCFGHSQDSQVLNYKAITIGCSGSMLADFRPVVIDFATREAVQVQIK